jgi:putative transposase
MAKSGVQIPAGSTIAVRQLQIRLTPDQLRILDFLFERSRALYNQAMYISRKAFIAGGFIPKKGTLFFRDEVRARGFRSQAPRKKPGKDELLAVNPKPHPWTVPLQDRFAGGTLEALEGSVHRKALPASVADQVLWSVHEAWDAYRELRTSFAKGQVPFRPKPPGYLKAGTAFKLAFPNSGGGKPKIVEILDEATGELIPHIRFPLGDTMKTWFGCSELVVALPIGIEPSLVREWTFRKKNGAVLLEISLLREKPPAVSLDPSLILGIDPGTSSNLAACVGTDGSNLLIDARQLKSMNQWYNRCIALRKKGKAEDYWDARCDRLTLKRNNQMRDGVNKAAKLIVNHCLERGIGTVVFGWNTGIKTGVHLGKKTNQSFVQMPLARLKERVRQVCELHGVQFHEQEESYTSKSSHLDGDTPPVFGSKPTGWTASGTRTKRGLYRSATGMKVNADLHGAANIMLKHVTGTAVEGTSTDLQRYRLGRRCLTTARRTRLWAGQRKAACSSQSTFASASLSSR